MNTSVQYECRDGVAYIDMDDGKVNVMSAAMLDALHGAFDRATADRAIVVFRSARPGVFSAGFDLKVFAVGDVTGSVAMVKAGAELALKLLTFPSPVIAICAGHAYPMGAFLLLGSDLRLGLTGDYRIGLNEVSVGIPVPGFALEIARHRLHPAWLSRTATTGEMFAPADAVTAGFLDRLLAPEELESVLAGYVKDLSRIHRPSHQIVKQRLRAPLVSAVRAAIDSEITAAAFEAAARGQTSVKLPST
jgi:enoyl-CoA hydratase